MASACGLFEAPEPDTEIEALYVPAARLEAAAVSEAVIVAGVDALFSDTASQLGGAESASPVAVPGAAVTPVVWAPGKAEPMLTENDSDAGVTARIVGGGLCVTVKLCPAAIRVAVRVDAVALAATA